jgi:DNA-directed RNA polymerase subunit RPC12/RpoP
VNQLVAVAASKRCDQLAFSELTEADHAVDVGVYACPHCKSRIQFSTTALRQFEAARGLALGPAWNERCQAFRPLEGAQYAMDFRCRGCDRPIRIVYEAVVDGKGAGFRLLHVIEERR